MDKIRSNFGQTKEFYGSWVKFEWCKNWMRSLWPNTLCTTTDASLVPCCSVRRVWLRTEVRQVACQSRQTRHDEWNQSSSQLSENVRKSFFTHTSALLLAVVVLIVKSLVWPLEHWVGTWTVTSTSGPRTTWHPPQLRISDSWSAFRSDFDMLTC